jgi:hypothetical protein
MSDRVSDYVLDNGLLAVQSLADKIYICSQDPLTFADATVNYALGNNDFGVGLVFGPPAEGSPNGRVIASNPITNGTVTATGTAAKWAVVDSVNSRLLVNGSLGAPKAVTQGTPFTLDSFTIQLPDQ